MSHQHIPVVALLVGFLVTSPVPTWALQEEPDSPVGEVTELDAIIARGVELIVTMQEGEETSQWPYEGVYRVEGEIPIGYRVGGTAIGVLALVHTPGYEADASRQAAVARGLAFIIASIDHPLMTHQFESRYDVRGWGYTYGLTCLLQCKEGGFVPPALAEPMEKAVAFFIDGIEATEIPDGSGWNYARRAGFDKPGRPAPFMTAPTLQALFIAHQQGYPVDAAMVERGLDSLEQGRTSTGAFLYAGTGGREGRAAVPGAVGRMLVSETTLYLAGRSSLERVRGGIDAFLTHWQWLEKRRAQSGTHVRPYGIAPYYYYFAHYYAAQAIEQLPERDRAEYRRRLTETLLSVRLPDGSWNDRVFSRSANYGTAMAVMALAMPATPPLVRWPSAPPADAPTPDGPAAPQTPSRSGSDEAQPASGGG